jgi:hypothetical protein
MLKIWFSQTAHRWEYSMAHALCMLDNEGYTHSHTHAHIHSEYVIVTSFLRVYWLREHTSLLRDIYIAWLVLFYDTVR